MDDNFDAFATALSVFTGGLSFVDYRICMIVFNGCPEHSTGTRQGIRTLVHTDFSATPPCTIGTDVWATNETEFAKLFNAVELYYNLPAGVGTGWEDQFGALWWAIENLDWREGCRKAPILFTDEEVQVETAPCDPYLDFTDSSLYKVMEYCRAESVEFFAVCPPDSEMAWQPEIGEDPGRAVYAGYRVLAESTGGIWSNIYDTSYVDMVATLAEAIAGSLCCYRFRYSTEQYCTGADVNLAVAVTKGGFTASDDSAYLGFCQPELEYAVPASCNGITSCANQQIISRLTNPQYGALVPSSISLSVNGSSVSSSEIAISGDTLTYNPLSAFSHNDTVVFEYTSLKNVWGCEGLAPPCTFFVDLEPPEIIANYPTTQDTLWDYETWVKATLVDDFSGINDASVPGAITLVMEDDTLMTSAPVWTTFDDSVVVSIDTVFGCGDGIVTVCIEDIFDSPTYDYCPPNVMKDCWEFFIKVVRREVEFPTLHALPCEEVLIPLTIDGLEHSYIDSATMLFSVNPEVLIPLEIVTGGALTEGWSVDSVYIDTTAGTIQAFISGAALFGGSGETFLYLKARVPCDAIGGDFTPIAIESFLFNDGFPLVTSTAGFFYVDLVPEFFSCDLRLNRIGTPKVEDFVLTFGASYGGSEDYDAGLDVMHVPPPAYMVNGWFPLEDSEYLCIKKLRRDVRYPMPPVVWYVVTAGEPNGVARWNPNALPEGEFRMNEIIDMKRDSVAYFSEGDTLVIEWFFPTLEPWNIHLYPGWNLVSSPVLPTDVVPTRIFPTEYNVFRYVTPTKRYGFADNIQQGEGYWVWSNVDTTYTIAGGIFDGYCRQAYKGWQLIGAPADEILTMNVAVTPSSNIIGIWEWDGSDYYPATSLQPGKGYWLLSDNWGTFEVPAGHCRRSNHLSEPLWEGTIEIVTGSEMELLTFGYAPTAAEGLSVGDIALPPVPPDIEPRRAILLADGVELSLDLSPDGEWVLLLREPAEVIITYPDDIELEVGALPIISGQPLSLAAGLHKIEARSPLPEEYRILGCVPNPFNAQTDILVALPNMEVLNVEIYDISGRNVRRIEGKYAAGIARISWDGRSSEGSKLPSGLYLVRVAAESWSATARAILIK